MTGDDLAALFAARSIHGLTFGPGLYVVMPGPDADRVLDGPFEFESEAHDALLSRLAALDMDAGTELCLKYLKPNRMTFQ